VECGTVRLSQMKVLAVDHRGPYPTIGEGFDRLGAFVGQRKIDVSGSQWLAIFLDDPETVPADDLRSLACVTVPEGLELPAGVQGVSIVLIPGGLYATGRHTGPYSGLQAAWNDLCGRWIPGNGLKPAAGMCFEIYVKGCDEVEDPGQCITDLYEPVEPSE
jgi:AraC family transcriptional regulator